MKSILDESVFHCCPLLHIICPPCASVTAPSDRCFLIALTTGPEKLQPLFSTECLKTSPYFRFRNQSTSWISVWKHSGILTTSTLSPVNVRRRHNMSGRHGMSHAPISDFIISNVLHLAPTRLGMCGTAFIITGTTRRQESDSETRCLVNESNNVGTMGA